MKFFSLSLLALLVIAGLATVPRPVSGAAAGAAGGGPVIIELFTSQGCSSCPPADRLLTQLGDDPRLAGRVIPLSFHVDYWNYIGWKDPFSSADWSGRQNRYAAAFRSDRVYTPQVVVNGRSECVGSEEGLVRQRIDEALKAPASGRVALKLDPAAGAKLTVAVEAGLLNPGARPGRDLDVWVALYQKNLSTSVGRGENAHRTLRNDYVVRQLVKAFTISGGATKSGEVALAIDPAWKRADLGVAAFLQDPTTMAIQGAAVASLSAR